MAFARILRLRSLRKGLATSDIALEAAGGRGRGRGRLASRERGRGWSLLLDRVLPSTARLVVLSSSWSEGDGGPPLETTTTTRRLLLLGSCPSLTCLRCTLQSLWHPYSLPCSHTRTLALMRFHRAGFSPPLAMRRPSHRCDLFRRQPRLALLLFLLVALALNLPAFSASFMCASSLSPSSSSSSATS